MTARIIDGKVIAAELRARVADEVARVQRDHQLTPGLAVVLVGNDPASEVYVRSKHKQTQAAGMASFEHVLPADVAQSELLALIGELNRDPAVHGILVQLPLPKSLTPKPSSTPSIPPRMSTGCIRPMPDVLPADLPHCRRARRSAASS